LSVGASLRIATYSNQNHSFIQNSFINNIVALKTLSHCRIIYSMKTLTNLILIVGLLLGGMIYLGYISVDELKDVVLGEVTMGETKHKYTEADFRQVFDLIVGEVEVTDTSSTAFERNNPLCDKAYVVHTADAVLKYEVKTTDDLFLVDVDSMTYFISDKLGVTYYETNRNNQMSIQESNCIKARDIKATNIDRTREIAEADFRDAVAASDKIVEANRRFEVIKRELISSFEKLGFREIVPENVFKD